jgi:hypothetical protein
MATVGDTMTINPGQSVTLTVAGNMTTTNASTYSGQVASLAVTGVNVSSGTVGGSLPITGAMQTFNSTLTMGTVTINNFFVRSERCSDEAHRRHRHQVLRHPLHRGFC